MLLTKRSVKKKKLTLNEKKQLDRALFVNYCKQKTKIISALQTDATTMLNNTHRYKHKRKKFSFFVKAKAINCVPLYLKYLCSLDLTKAINDIIYPLW